MTGIIRMFRGSQRTEDPRGSTLVETNISLPPQPRHPLLHQPRIQAPHLTQRLLLHNIRFRQSQPNLRRPPVPPRKFRPLSTMAKRGRARHPDYPIERLRNDTRARLHASRHLGPRTHTLDSLSQLLPPLNHPGHTSSNDRRQFLHRRTPPV